MLHKELKFNSQYQAMIFQNVTDVIALRCVLTSLLLSLDRKDYVKIRDNSLTTLDSFEIDHWRKTLRCSRAEAELFLNTSREMVEIFFSNIENLKGSGN